ncbi:MAG: sulfotransferase [Gammaproteobacteria bacterium]|nr:sulfotransferase [Gammaproteobacteria bacterium]
MTDAATPLGTLETALRHTLRLLARSPGLAAEQAAEILRIAPGHPLALLYLGAARRALGDPEGALAVLEPLAAARPAWAEAQYELALALSAVGRGGDAIAALRRAVVAQPEAVDAWRALGDRLFEAGDAAGADAAYAQSIRAATRDPRLLAPAAALCANDVPTAEALLRAHLKQFPTDVAAIRMFAEVAARLRRYRDAEHLLARCLELNPSFKAARHQYALVLHREHKPVEALREIDGLLAEEPHNPAYRNLKAAILGRIGEVGHSIEIYAELLARHAEHPKIWMSYGHALKTAGREADSIAAYREAVARQSALGEAWWSLANLKTFRFSPAEIDTMRAELDREGLGEDDRFHLRFALGKALEDEGEYAAAFAHYREGNRLRRAGIAYSADELGSLVARSKAMMTEAFFAERQGHGSEAPDPIFIVGLPRAGSTLVEQILASHSMVEGTMELPDLPAIAKEFYGRRADRPGGGYPEALAALDAARCRELGERYLQQTRIQRKRGTPLFIDKLPNNFMHVGLIQLILPRAKIIDARRHPLACGFSCFKQHFALGQHFTYDLEELGRYYRDYVELMAHFDRVLPGRVHRVFHEAMVDHTESEVRRLLEYCGLEFEPACLRFYENERAVRTASAQQVRRPIFREGLDHWRHFEPWLGPLRDALGSVLTAYPAVPDFAAAAPMAPIGTARGP